MKKAKRIRWFGIDREKKQKATWENDIFEVGYKYQMTDLGASVGLEGLKDFNKVIKHRQNIFNIYLEKLIKNKNINVSIKMMVKDHMLHGYLQLFLRKRLNTKKIKRKKN